MRIVTYLGKRLMSKVEKNINKIKLLQQDFDFLLNFSHRRFMKLQIIILKPMQL